MEINPNQIKSHISTLNGERTLPPRTKIYTQDAKEHTIQLTPPTLTVTRSAKGQNITKEFPLAQIISVRLAARDLKPEQNGPIQLKNGEPTIDEHDKLIAYKNARNFESIEKCSELILYYADRKSKNRWYIRPINLLFLSVNSRKVWEKALKRQLIEHSKRPKRLLVFYNPYGGKRRAHNIYRTKLLPQLLLASIEHKLVETLRQNYARDYLLDNELDNYSGVVAIGGDGIYNEVLHALAIKTQMKANIDHNIFNATLRSCTLPVGIMPAGSTNALVNTVHSTTDQTTAAIHIVLGNHRLIDMIGMYLDDKMVRFSCLFVSNGLLGSGLVKSERMRNMGPFRYKVAGIQTLAENRDYKCKLQWKTGTPNKQSSDERCVEDCKVCLDEAVSEAGDLAKADKVPKYDQDKAVEFHYIWLACIVNRCSSTLSPKGLEPNAHIADGRMQLVLLDKGARTNTAMFLLRLFSGKHKIDQEGMTTLSVKAFSYLPVLKPNEKIVPWNIDGELIEQKASDVSHFRVHKRLNSVYFRGEPADSNKTNQKVSSTLKSVFFL